MERMDRPEKGSEVKLLFRTWRRRGLARNGRYCCHLTRGGRLHRSPLLRYHYPCRRRYEWCPTSSCASPAQPLLLRELIALTVGRLQARRMGWEAGQSTLFTVHLVRVKLTFV